MVNFHTCWHWQMPPKMPLNSVSHLVTLLCYPHYCSIKDNIKECSKRFSVTFLVQLGPLIEASLEPWLYFLFNWIRDFIKIKKCNILHTSFLVLDVRWGGSCFMYTCTVCINPVGIMYLMTKSLQTNQIRWIMWRKFNHGNIKTTELLEFHLACI